MEILRRVDKRSLGHLARRFRESENRTKILRSELAEAIRQAVKDGVAQKDICEVTGYTRQQIRRISHASAEESTAQTRFDQENTS